jgi:hypothetical protein
MEQPSAQRTLAQPDDELAAAIAAVEIVLQEAQRPAATEPASGSDWHSSAKLSVQGLRPARTSIAPRWATIERLRRGGSGSGVVGL